MSNRSNLGFLAASAYMAAKNKEAACNLILNNWTGPQIDRVFAGHLWDAIDSYEDRRESAEQLKFQGLLGEQVE